MATEEIEQGSPLDRLMRATGMSFDDIVLAIDQVKAVQAEREVAILVECRRMSRPGYVPPEEATEAATGTEA